MRVLQIGYGAFGATHLSGWRRVGIEAITVADPSPAARDRAAADGAAVVADWSSALAAADAVDIVAPTDRHFDMAAAALEAGKPVFVEKPMTATVVEAEQLARLAGERGTPLQLGLYCRFHPKAIWLKERCAELGRLRYASGLFAGLKRGRRDSGALANDAIHFIDLAGWMIGRPPLSVHAEIRDHSGRGIEDFALVLLAYPDGALAKIEAGYIQPGGRPDPIVPGALSVKRFDLSGENGVGMFDLQTDTASLRNVRHEVRDGLWVPDFGTEVLSGAPAAGPVEVMAAQFAAFLDWIGGGRPVDADARAGLVLAKIVAAAQDSARRRRPVDIA